MLFARFVGDANFPSEDEVLPGVCMGSSHVADMRFAPEDVRGLAFR